MKSLFLSLLYLAIVLCSLAQSPGNLNPNTSPGFLPNKGQIRDLNQKRVNDVYYQANLGGQQVFLTKNGLSIVFTHIKSSFPEAILQPAIQQQHDARDSFSTARIEMERIDITLKNASILPQNIVSTENPASPDFHFYIDDNTSATTRLRTGLCTDALRFPVQ
jgi:hypothetical protein